MFIRKKANKGGSYSILLLTGERIPGKKHVVSRMIKNFGSATTETELKKLIEQAESYKAELQACAPKKVKPLKINADIDLASCCSYRLGFSDVYGHLFGETFSELPLKPELMRRLCELVIMRIATACSKRKTASKSGDYGVTLTVNGIYRLMDLMTPSAIKNIKQAVYQHTARLLSERKQRINVLFYDLTTVYFETSTQDELRNFGFSKDGKHQHVQIMLAVIVTQEGLPIDYETFPGNCYEGHTLIPVINNIQKRYQIGKAVLVADAALMNKINLQELSNQGMNYVVAARIRNTKKDITKAILDLTTYKNVSRSRNSEGILEDEIKAKKIKMETGDWLIAYHSSKRARKDAWDRQKDIEKIKNYLASTGKNKLTHRLKKSYIILKKDCSIEINPEKLKLEENYDGFFGLRTNIKNADPKELLSTYRGLWQVEQTFRIAKSELEIRPVFHYTLRRIQAHFALCYMALALVRYAEFILKRNDLELPTEQIHSLLEKMCVVRIKNSSGDSFEILQDYPSQLRMLYEILNVPWRKKFSILI